MNISEIRAEALKHVETEGVAHTDRGDNPRPIRKRGFYRALKAHKTWAVMDNSLRIITKNLVMEMYTKPSPFLKMIGLSKHLED